ncbi:MAG TPA: hypothetical protein VG897_02640 [Terriglobales bacterium]|nr:hypothetical protein [Terriglobales bacterium]
MRAGTGFVRSAQRVQLGDGGLSGSSLGLGDSAGSSITKLPRGLDGLGLNPGFILFGLSLFFVFFFMVVSRECHDPVVWFVSIQDTAGHSLRGLELAVKLGENFAPNLVKIALGTGVTFPRKNAGMAKFLNHK